MEAAESKEREKLMEEMGQKFEELLRIIREETLQLSEFLIEEKKLTHELYSLLRPVLKQLNTSFNIPSKAIPLPKKVKEIFLNAEGHLILIDENNRVNSKALEDYSPEIILNVLWVVIPPLCDAVVSYRKRVSFRVSLFSKINQELRNLYKTFVERFGRPEGAEETQKEKSQEDAVRKSLLSRQ